MRRWLRTALLVVNVLAALALMGVAWRIVRDGPELAPPAADPCAANADAPGCRPSVEWRPEPPR